MKKKVVLVPKIKNTNQSTDKVTTSTTSRVEDGRALRMAQFKKHLETANSLKSKTKLNRYQAANCKEDHKKFGILAW